MGLRNPKWEQLAVSVGTGKSPIDAYFEIYGCSRKTASNAVGNLLKKPEILKRIRQVQDRLEAQSIHAAVMNRQWLIEKLKRVISHAMRERPVVRKDGTILMGEDVDGNPIIITEMENARVAVQGIELAGREQNMFARTTKKPIESDPLENKSYEEMLKIAKRADEEIARHVRERDEQRGGQASATGSDADTGGDEETSPPGVPPLQ